MNFIVSNRKGNINPGNKIDVGLTLLPAYFHFHSPFFFLLGAFIVNIELVFAPSFNHVWRAKLKCQNFWLSNFSLIATVYKLAQA